MLVCSWPHLLKGRSLRKTRGGSVRLTGIRGDRNAGHTNLAIETASLDVALTMSVKHLHFRYIFRWFLLDVRSKPFYRLDAWRRGWQFHSL